MPLVSMRQLLDEAAAASYGVGAFNVNNMEQIQAVMEAASETRSPVIIQASRGARSYTNDRFLILRVPETRFGRFGAGVGRIAGCSSHASIGCFGTYSGWSCCAADQTPRTRWRYSFCVTSSRCSADR
jgi:hypothetical protein